MKNAISWFAIPALDFKRAVKFYNDIFDFELDVKKMDDRDIAFFPIEEGGIGGHITTAEAFKPSEQGPILYLNGGDNLQTVLDRIESSGGKIKSPKTQIAPGMGYIGVFFDTEGNRVALYSQK